MVGALAVAESNFTFSIRSNISAKRQRPKGNLSARTRLRSNLETLKL